MRSQTWTFRVLPDGTRAVFLGLRRLPTTCVRRCWDDSPATWEWGITTLSAYQLAHTILFETTGDDLFAGALYMEFAEAEVFRWLWDRDHTLESSFVEEWVRKAWLTRHRDCERGLAHFDLT